MRDAMTKRYLKVGEMAELLNVSTSTLWNWRKEGIGPEYIRLGNAPNSHVRYKPLPDDLDTVHVPVRDREGRDA